MYYLFTAKQRKIVREKGRRGTGPGWDRGAKRSLTRLDFEEGDVITWTASRRENSNRDVISKPKKFYLEKVSYLYV